MPTATYIALANLTLGSADAEVEFSSIPATYRDLVLVINADTASSGNAGKIQINGDTTVGNYTSVRMVGSSGGASSNTNGETIRWEVSAASNNLIIVNFMDYSATDKHKTVLVRANANGAAVEASANRWANTNAITSFKVYYGYNFSAGATFALYGIVS